MLIASELELMVEAQQAADRAVNAMAEGTDDHTAAGKAVTRWWTHMRRSTVEKRTAALRAHGIRMMDETLQSMKKDAYMICIGVWKRKTHMHAQKAVNAEQVAWARAATPGKPTHGIWDQRLKGDGEKDRFEGPPVHWTKELAERRGRRTRAHPAGSREGRKTTAFCGYAGEQKVTMGADTYSEVTLISNEVDDSGWEVLSTEPLELVGVGEGSAWIGNKVKAPLKFRTGRETIMVEARMCDPKHLPQGVDVLLGTDIQHTMKMKVDQGNERLEMKSAGRSGIVIDLEQTKLLKRRMRSRGLKVLINLLHKCPSFDTFWPRNFTLFRLP